MGSEMDSLLDAISSLVAQVSPEKLKFIAECIRQTEPDKAVIDLSRAVSTPQAASAIKQISHSWQKTSITSNELAAMLLAALHTHEKITSAQSIELVLTGPTTPFVSTRRTEQTIIQVINTAEQSLLITSFVAYSVSNIIDALNAASDRGVKITMLLESSSSHGGSISIDVIGKMRCLVPNAKLYAWTNKNDAFIDGKVHAKVVVADNKLSFITSANLTGHAMEKNIEAGVLISGKPVASQLDEHFRTLISMKILSLV